MTENEIDTIAKATVAEYVYVELMSAIIIFVISVLYCSLVLRENPFKIFSNIFNDIFKR